MEDRLVKAIKFFREFREQSDRLLYRKYVMTFCDLVEEYINGKKDILEVAEKIFNEESADST